MWLADISIKRPVFATVMSLLLILFGMVSISFLSVREYPDIDPPVVSVNTVYPGASAEVIETTITEILEDELIGIEGIKSMTSSSREEISAIVIEFELSREINAATQDVRDRVFRAQGRLPDDSEDPIISKQDTDANAIMWIGLSGEGQSPLQVTDYADRYIVDHLQTVPGVGTVILGGGREYSMRIWLDPQKLAARKITVLDVEEALQKENVELPSGRVEGITREFSVRTRGELKTPDEFNQLIIKRTETGAPVYLRDIGRAEIGPKNYRSLIRFNGQPGVGLGIVKQSKANTLDVAHGIKDKLETLAPQLPSGMQMELAYDSSEFIETSIDEVISSLWIAFFLVVAVIYLFLRSLRATFIPAIAIPISLIASFIIMYLLGYTINTITLLGLTLAIGLVVDDNIVVLENIYRRIEMGESPTEAAKKGTDEIGFAIIATTITLISVFLPIVFLEGTTGRLLREFAVVVAFSVGISGFVSLSLAPMLCSRLLKKEDKATQHKTTLLTAFTDWFTRQLNQLSGFYNKTLQTALHHRGVILTISALFIAVSIGIYQFVPKEFLPTDDRSFIFTIISAPEGATMAYTDRAVRQAEEIYKTVPEVARQFSVVALSAEGVGRVNQGMMFVDLDPAHERHRKQQQIVASVFPRMMMIPEALVFPINPPSGPNRGFGTPIQLALQGTDINELEEVSTRIVQKAQQEITGFIRGDTDLKLDKPQLDIQINREKASSLGVSVRDIGRTLQILLGGQSLSTFNLNNKSYDVMVQAFEEDRLTPQQIENIFVKGQPPNSDDDTNSQMIPLSSVLKYNETVAPKELNHYNRLRSATISGDIAPIPGLTLGSVLTQLEQIARREMSLGMTLAWKGEAKEFYDAGNATLYAFALALIVVFLVLAAQFESYIDPLIVMLTVPLAICGGILTLFILTFGQVAVTSLPFLKDMAVINFSINVYSQIGLVLLIGLVTKNGILIVEFANQITEQKPDLKPLDAVYEAARIRFRPILMTSISTIMGAIPIAIGLGTGIDGRKPLGAVIVGGMLLSTLLTLYLIPIAYDVIKSLRNKKKPTAS